MYSGREGRKRLEYDSSNMIAADHGAIANLPQGVMIKAYPASPAYYEGMPSDTIRGIDHQMSDDSRKGKKEKYPEKY